MRRVVTVVIAFMPLVFVTCIALCWPDNGVRNGPLHITHRKRMKGTAPLFMALFGGAGAAAPSIPKNPSDRNKQAISAIKAAIASPQTPSFPLIECEFPALTTLNKLGDGSLRSTKEAEEVNLDFAIELIRALSPLPPIFGPRTWLLTSAAAPRRFLDRVRQRVKGSSTPVHSLYNGLPETKVGDVCVILNPSSQQDYDAARKIASSLSVFTVIINGFAKDAKSVPADATMAYYLKPLTYNSQIVGYLVRKYPGQWTTIDAITRKVLNSASDKDILVKGTNTPDLRGPGRLVQKSFDERAIQSRRRAMNVDGL